jgi:BirA family biotin operon repressor/biotin-[acetyl-CoA-carboxylase] ligase
MTILPISSPFQAPVFHLESTTSTMEEARKLADDRLVPGTVVVVDEQTHGKGRGEGRRWVSERGMNLLCTVILSYSSIETIPRALTLKIGLAVALAIEEQFPELAGLGTVKWPNDILIRGKKVCGILTEGDGKRVFAGIGLNILQRNFPPEIQDRASSLVLEVEEAKRADSFVRFGDRTEGIPGKKAQLATDPFDRWKLLAAILRRLYDLLEKGAPWKEPLEQRLFKRGQGVLFLDGRADQGKPVEGILLGVGDGGALRLRCGEAGEERSFVAGELSWGQKADTPPLGI